MGDCAGMPTRSACAFVPATPMPADSEVVARYKRAGFIPFAKTNAPELGIPPVTESRLYGPARNPWSLERTPGGSSGGSAAAVAAGNRAGRAWQRRRRLDSDPGGVLRAGRTQADAWPYLARAESRRRPGRLRRRARVEQNRSRQRGGARRDRGSDARRSILPASTGAALSAGIVGATEAASNRILNHESARRRDSSGLRRGDEAGGEAVRGTWTRG